MEALKLRGGRLSIVNHYANISTKSMLQTKNELISGAFFDKSTVKLARDLLGTYLVHNSLEGKAVGRIVETEAYISSGDAACHASRGKTKRNSVMFGPAGHAYVYLCYGMYQMFNIVSGPEDCGEAVLIRALEPVFGLDLMKQRRGVEQERLLCNGPGKLVIALGITPSHNGQSLMKGKLKLLPRDAFAELYPPQRKYPIVTTTRIGIHVAADLPLRFYLKGNPFISKP